MALIGLLSSSYLEEPGEDRTAVGHELLVLVLERRLFGQFGDDDAERRQRLVDVGALLEAIATGARLRHPLRAGQVHQRHLAHLCQVHF